MRLDRPTAPAEQTLRDFAMGLPEAEETFPWEHRAIKVRKKTFVFLFTGEEGFSLSVKLPESRDAALQLPGAEPTGYGLGRSGWVTACFDHDVTPPVELLREWIEESYRAIAPKRLAARLVDTGA